MAKQGARGKTTYCPLSIAKYEGAITEVSSAKNSID